MKMLHLSKDLAVPADIATEAVAFIGARGSGKTHAAGKLFEELYDAGVQVVWLDPVGVAYGLRLARDGNGPGLPVPVFGGLHGDVPLEPGGGALIADVVVDKNISAVIDVSQFDTDADKARFIAGFSDRLFARKKRAPSVICMILDEGQEFVPQNPQPGEQMMLHRLVRQIKIGRNFGMGVVILSPRPQEINKKALNGCQTVLAFRLTGAHERKAMREWIAAHDIDQGVIERLPGLETGTCHVWSPAFLKVNKQIRIAPKRTFDASATPKVGEHRAARELAPIDIAQLREAMAATVEKAKAEDPKLLQERVRTLERQLAARAKIPKDAGVKIVPVEVPVLRETQVKRLEVALEKARKVQEAAVGAILVVTKVLDRFRPASMPPAQGASVRAAMENWKMGLDAVNLPKTVAETPAGKKMAAALAAQHRAVGEMVGDVKLGPSHRRVLNTLAWLAQLGVMEPERPQVAVLAGMTPSGGYYARIVGELKTAGLVDYPSGGALLLTDAGEAQADPGKAHQTNEEIQADVLARLGPSHQRLLRNLIQTYPQSLARGAAADLSQMDAAGGYYARVVGELKTMGVLTYPSKGELRAAEILFVKPR
ncbi:MAG: hypothetical protein V4510_09805 [bacterium]